MTTMIESKGRYQIPIYRYRDYRQYLASPEWRAKVRAVKLRSWGWCERHPAGEARMTAVHHLTYLHIFDEPLEDLQAVCDDCHLYLSGFIDIDPVDIYQTKMDLDDVA